MSVLLEGVSLAPGEENYLEIVDVIDPANCLFHEGLIAHFVRDCR
jgi:hypothetical protein